MVPKSDIERFIQAIIDDGDAPSAAKCRIEQYLTDILEERVSTLEPAFRIEYYLAKISGADVELPGPISRADLYLAALAGEDVTIPDTPNSPLEELLAKWCETGDAVSTITGDVVHFTGRTNTEIQSMSVDLQPVQELHGYDSPWPAGGGENLIPSISQTGDGFIVNERLLDDGSTSTNYGYYISKYFPVEAGETYTYSVIDYASPTTTCVCFYDNDYTFLTAANGLPNGNTITAPNNAVFARASNTKPDTSISFAFNKGPYSNICPITGYTGANIYVSPNPNQADATVYNEDWTSEAGMVYAGSYEAVSGKLKAHPQYASYNGEALVGPWLSSMDAYTPSGTPTTGAQVVDLGGAETEYTLTPQEVTALLGQNNIWSDAGDVTVVIKGGFTD